MPHSKGKRGAASLAADSTGRPVPATSNISKKRKKAPSPPGIADDLSPDLVDEHLNLDLEARVFSFLESTEVDAMNDVNLTFATFADNNNKFEVRTMGGVVMVCENWKDVLDAKRVYEDLIMKHTATKAVSKHPAEPTCRSICCSIFFI